ncbi:MAG: T9SS type A sorting domain-containing protein [Bacteroidales bacterium]|nr:T9SS type A sorting domain-containing protein [Bacteroidales bacterium]
MNIAGRNSRLSVTGSGLLTLLLVCASAMQAYSQGALKGPQNPPPKEMSKTVDHSENEGWIGRAGGLTYTFTNITLANTTTVYWTMLADSIKLSMDGGVYEGAEVLTFDATTSNLAGGIAVWTGATNIPVETGSPAPLLVKFSVTVVDQADAPLPLTDAISVGLTANSGGILPVTGNTMVFKVKMEMFVSGDGGTTYLPHLDYYDAAPTPPEAISAYSSYTYGFYWENDPPVLENILILNVDEGDTAKITSSILKAVDVESDSSDIHFILDAKKTGLWPQHGKLMNSDSDLAPGDTFTMEDIDKELMAYVHDGGETVKDTIAVSVVDGDGGKYKNEEDSIFFLIVNVTPYDDSPTVETNEGMTLNEGLTLALSDAMLLTSDPESISSAVTYTLDPEGNSDLPGNGLLKLNGIPMSDRATFTQADIHDGKLEYQHDGSETVLDGFVFQVADEFGHLAEDNGNNIFFFEIRITPVNDLPVLSKNMPLTVNQGAEAIISNLFLAATDAESDPQHITFTLDPDGNVDQPTSGVVKLNTTTLTDGQTFTMADINNNLVKYVQNGSANTADFLAFSVSDADGGVASDAGFTIFHLNVTITLQSALDNTTANSTGLFTLSPNPVTDWINLSFNGEAKGPVKLVLFNNIGEKIWEKKLEAVKEYSIPFSDYPAGVYYLKSGRNREVQTEKIIKQ